MSYAALLTQRCAIVHLGPTGGTDKYNNPSWGETSTDEDVPCRVQRLDLTGTGTELTDGRDTAIATHRAFLLTGQAIAWYDRVVLDGQVYEVTGPPDIVHDGAGPHHVEVLLRTVSDWSVT